MSVLGLGSRKSAGIGVVISVVVGAGALSAVTGSSASAAGRTFFVSTSGSDKNSGSNGAPFRSIQRCADVVVGGDTCQIGAGVYRETVKPRNSGSAAAPITFVRAPGARVVLDGTDPVGGWSLDRGHIYKAAVTLAGSAAAPYSATEFPANGDLWANQVFVNGAVSPEAAYPAPSTDPWKQAFINGGWGSTRSATGSCTKPPCTKVINGTVTYKNFPAFGDMTGAVAYFAGGWVALSAKVTGGNLNGANKTIKISFPQSDTKVYPGGGNDHKMRLVGKKAFLTGPNQWFYDAGARQLFVWAPDGRAPRTVFAKKRNYGFDLWDRSFIHVTGINVYATTITTSDRSEGVVLDMVNGQYLSHWQTAQYDANLPLAGIYDANHRFDSGIILHGKNDTFKNGTLQQSAGNGINLRGSGHTVTNSLIHDVGYGGTYTAAVTLEVGTHDSSITDNTLRDTGRDVINMNTNAFPNPGYHNNRIAFNNIYGYARVAFDLGGIYACCNDSLAGTRIDHNRIHDPANTGNGMHFDNGTYNISVDHNAIWGLKSNGDVNHGGNGINFGAFHNGLPYLSGTIQNNTIIAGKGYTIFEYFANAKLAGNTTVKNNILDGAHPGGQDYGYPAGAKPNKSNNLITTHSQNGAGIDPRYTNPGATPTLANGSPAIDKGITIPGITTGFSGKAPDQGAYETGQTSWLSGCHFTGCNRG